MAVMLRTIDIPSRNVTGFAGGTYNKFGEFYAVRQGDAHSWVEAYVAGRGWLTFDPTPPGAAAPQTEIEGMLASLRDFFEAVSQRWNQHVLGYDLRQQVGLFESLGSRHQSPADLLRRPRTKHLLGALGLLIAGACVYWLRRRRKQQNAEPDAGVRKRNKDEAVATGLYQTLDRAMSVMGIARSTATPPLCHARAVAQGGHPRAPEVLSLTVRYLDARFGGRPLSNAERRDFEGRIRTLKTSLKAGSSAPTPADGDQPAVDSGPDEDDREDQALEEADRDSEPAPDSGKVPVGRADAD
jgi:hypothetical protein